MPDGDERQNDFELANLVEELAKRDAGQSAEPTQADDPADSTVKELKAELDTLAERLREPVPVDPFQDESAFRRGLSLVEAIGRDPSIGEGKSVELDEDLGSLRESQLVSRLGQGGMGNGQRGSSDSALESESNRIKAPHNALRAVRF